MVSKHKRNHRKNHKNHPNTPRVRRAPNGFFFKVEPDGGTAAHIRLWHHEPSGKDVRVGYVWLAYDRENAVETHSRLDPLYWGKGLGALMYAKAIQYAHRRGWKVRSSNGPSSYAQRVWSGHELRKYFIIVRKNREGSGYATPRWYAYPKGN